MANSDDLQRDIEKQQNAIEALNAQIQQAQDRDQRDQVPGLQGQIDEHNRQIQNLNSDLADAQKEELKEAQEKAREEQKEEDDKSGGILSGIL